MRLLILLGMVVFAAIGYKTTGEISIFFIFLGGIVGGIAGWRFDRWRQS